MINDLDFILNFAATTRFDERYDVALGTNALGAKNVLCFAKNCLKLKLFIHISTAYVCGESSGLIMEKSYQLGETLNGVLGLNIEEEKKLIDRKLNQLRREGATEANIKKAMIDMGTERAKAYGWPNTYVFTKAMGEMVIGHLKENLPVVIIRPTMVTSTWREPFPGWIEGARTIDALTVGYGSGKMSFFVADLTAIVDVIPADMVVNTIIAAMMVHANNQPCQVVYHIGSSLGNPIRYSNFRDYLYFYFTNKPWMLQNGKPVKVAKPTILTTMANFHRYIAIRYLPLLKVLKLANTISCHYFQGTYNNLNRNIKRVMRLVELYQPYLFFHGIFDDSNTNKLLRIAKDNGMETRGQTTLAKDNGMETNNFFFDVKSIDWDDYFINTHIPGILKYVLK
ncbi:fatty acyl-CoA reductase 3 isoform X1 [Jatropha curcas]|uniref:fatty acyl-CoA reductase 3 isoform X1 n=1 Tax=Jatropha curcas TaxID=180498 RepID=UPI001893828F|nr:fatty acyl-CoA reductase 3 isoform X1 [Jatropha curcas]